MQKMRKIMAKITIKLEGMHCASCASNIERSLKKIHGILDVRVNLLAKKGFIEAEHDIDDEEIRFGSRLFISATKSVFCKNI